MRCLSFSKDIIELKMLLNIPEASSVEMAADVKEEVW